MKLSPASKAAILTDRQSCLVSAGIWLMARAGAGDTVGFWLSEHRNLPAATRFLRKPFANHDRPERIVVDGSQTNREAISSCDVEDWLGSNALEAARTRQGQYLNNRIKRRIRPMLGFKSFTSANAALGASRWFT